MAEEDIINTLSDHLLLEIISRIKIMDNEKQEERFMSTKEVIQTTTTISKRWQHLWTRLPTLLFLECDIKGYRDDCVTNYFSFISETLTQCPTDVNLKEFKLQLINVNMPRLQPNSWIHYAITRNVQEIDLRIMDKLGYRESCDDELFFNNSCLTRLEVSRFVFNPPNGAIHWEKLKFLHIDDGELDEDIIGKILSGSRCLETLELNDCDLCGRIPKSLFGNFGVLERLSCALDTYERFSYDDELFLDDPYSVGMTLSRCVFDHHNGAIRWDKLKFLRIERGELDEDLIGKIVSGSPCLETLELCVLCGRIPKSLFGNFGVLERLSCALDTYERFSYDDELFLDDPYSVGMTLSRCVFDHHNGAIRWDKLKCLRIERGELDEDLIGKIVSGSPCLETLELSGCTLSGRIPKSLFGNFGVLERLSCDLETYERFRNDDELFLDDTYPVGMKLLRCVFKPNGAIHYDTIKFLYIDGGKLDDDSIGKILSRSPFLETLQLNNCYGFERIDITSKSVKNLVVSGYGYKYPDYYIDRIEINAPYILTLTIEGEMNLQHILLENVSSLVKADLMIMVTCQFAEEVGQDESDIEEELLRGLLSSLGHVKQIAVETFSLNSQARSRLEAEGFQFH